MAIEVPSLSPAGWVSGPAEKLDRLLSYYFVSEYSQTNLYQGRVKSLPMHIKRYGNDENALQDAMRQALEELLRPYFDQVSVNITTDKPIKDDLGRINVMVDIQVQQDSVTYSAGRELETLNGTLMRIIDINNNQGAN